MHEQPNLSIEAIQEEVATVDRGVFHKAVCKVTHDFMHHFMHDLYMKSQMGCSIIINCIN